MTRLVSSSKTRVALCALLAATSISAPGFAATGTAAIDDRAAKLRVAREDVPGERFLAGFYIYPYAVRKTADRLNLDYATYLDGWLRQLTERGFNLFYVAVDGPIDDWLRLSEKYRFKLVLQLDFAYLAADTPPTAERVLAAINFINKYKNHSNVLAFSIKEEPLPAEMPALDAYFSRIVSAVPDAPLHLLQNSHATLRYALRIRPLFAASDRYAFWGWDPSAGGYSATPGSALDWYRREMDAFASAARTEHAAFQAVFTTALDVGVTTEEIVRSGSFGNPERISRLATTGKQGWVRLPNGRLRYIKYYRPPPNATRAMVWLAIYSGARSALHWSGDPTDPVQEAILANEMYGSGSSDGRVGESNYASDLKRSDFAMQMMGSANQGSYMLEEYCGAVTELQSFGWIINRMSPDPDQQSVHIEGNKAFVRGFSVPGFHGKVLLVVNTDIGGWPASGTASDASFAIGKLGNLVGFVPQTQPQLLTIRSTSGSTLTRLSDAKVLGEPGQISLPPGSGAFLFAGETAELQRLRHATGLDAESGVRH